MQENQNKQGSPAWLAQHYDIPVEGSLGLLALGATGIKVWRAARAKASGVTDETKSTEHDEEE